MSPEKASFNVEPDLTVARARHPLDELLSGLSRQPLLLAPVKLTRQRGEGALLAEVMRVGDAGAAEACARDALERACSWLSGTAPEGPPEAAPPFDGEAIAATLECLPWSVEARDHGVRVHASSRGAECRIEICPCGAGVRVDTPDLPLQPGGEPVPQALRAFALGANARLKLARLTIIPGPEGLLAARFDAVVPFGAGFHAALPAAVGTVVASRAAIARTLRALCGAPLARLYLDLRAREVAHARWAHRRPSTGPQQGPTRA